MQVTDLRESAKSAETPAALCESSIPESRASEKYIAAAIFVVTLSYLCLFRNFSWIDPDEGIILQGAQRILTGQVLYRDFFSFFTPGSYYFLALVFRVFGNSFLVAHTALAVIGAAFSPLTYLLARRVCSRQASLLTTGLMTITALPLRFVVIHNWDSTLLALMALYCAVRVLESSSDCWAFAAASFVSLTGMFEQSKGACLLLGLIAGFLIITRRIRSGLFTRRRVLMIALGLAWPALITFIYFASQHALFPMLASWLWPVQHYSAANRVPYGYSNVGDSASPVFGAESWTVRLLKVLVFSPLYWFPVLPLLAVALLVRLTLTRNQRLSPDWPYYVLTSACISGLLLSVVVARKDYIHFVYLHPMFLLVLAWLLNGRNLRSRWVVRFAPVLGFCLSMSLVILGVALLVRAHPENKIETRRGELQTPEPDRVIAYVQNHVSAGEPMLVYPYEPTYYYLTATYSPTGYEFYQPGMHTREQALDMLAQLKSHPTRTVLYDVGFTGHIRNSWPNTPASELVTDPVANYIATEYRVCTVLGSAASNDTVGSFQFLFMIRKSEKCP